MMTFLLLALAMFSLDELELNVESRSMTDRLLQPAQSSSPHIGKIKPRNLSFSSLKLFFRPLFHGFTTFFHINVF